MHSYATERARPDVAIKGSPCPFLENERCSIYEFRPEVCRNYPIIKSLWAEGHYMLTVSIRCDSGADIMKAKVGLYCWYDSQRQFNSDRHSIIGYILPHDNSRG